MKPLIVLSSYSYEVMLILFWRVCGVQFVMANGGETNGMVPP